MRSSYFWLLIASIGLIAFAGNLIANQVIDNTRRISDLEFRLNVLESRSRWFATIPGVTNPHNH